MCACVCAYLRGYISARFVNMYSMSFYTLSYVRVFIMHARFDGACPHVHILHTYVYVGVCMCCIWKLHLFMRFNCSLFAEKSIGSHANGRSR